MRWPWSKEDVVGVDAPPKPAKVKKPKRKSKLEIIVETAATRGVADAVKKEVAASKVEILKDVLDVFRGFGAEHKEVHAALSKEAQLNPTALLEPLIAPLRLEVASFREFTTRAYTPANPPPRVADPRLSEFGDRLKLLEAGETGAGRPVKVAVTPASAPPPQVPVSPPADESGSVAEMLVRELRAGFAEVKAAVAGKQAAAPPAPVPAAAEPVKPSPTAAPRRPVGVALPASKKPDAKAKQKTTGPSPPDINVAEWQDFLSGWIDAWLSEHPDQAPSVPECFAALVEETGVFLVGTAANTFIGKNYANLNRAYIISVANGKMAALGLTKGKMPSGTREDVFWKASDGEAEA